MQSIICTRGKGEGSEPVVKVQIAENHAAGTNKKQILVVLRFEVSQVPKSEAPGAPSIEVNADHLFHVP